MLTQSVVFRVSIKSDFGVSMRDSPMIVDFDESTGQVLSAKHNDNHDELGRFASSDSSGGGVSGVKATKEVKAKVVGKVSRRFKAVVNDAIKTIDPAVMEKLDIHIVACPLITEGLPELAESTQKMKGWEAGSTWDNTNGIYDPNSHTAVVSESYVNRNGVAMKSDAQDMQVCVRHECGHAVDDRLGDKDAFCPFSHTDETFIDAYKQDVAEMLRYSKSEMSEAKCNLRAQAKELEYFLQPERWRVRGEDGKTSRQWTASRLGREEAFADAFAALYGGGCGGDNFEVDFPRCMKGVRDKMREITGNKKSVIDVWRKAVEASSVESPSVILTDSEPVKAWRFGHGESILIRRATGPGGLIGDAFIHADNATSK